MITICLASITNKYLEVIVEGGEIKQHSYSWELLLCTIS